MRWQDARIDLCQRSILPEINSGEMARINLCLISIRCHNYIFFPLSLSLVFGRSTVSIMGLKKVLHAPPEATLTSTFLTFLSWLEKVLTTMPMGQWFCLTWLSFKSTRSPSCRLGLSECHFPWPCRVERYWFFQCCQRTLERCCTCLHWHLHRSLSLKLPGGMDRTPTFWVWRVVHVRMRGKLESMDTRMRGHKLTIAVTSAKKVVNISWVSCQGVMLISTDSSIRLVKPIMRSQLPPMCEGWVG